MTELKLNKNLFNDIYFEYLFNYSKKFEVYYGGAASGKSVFVAQKILVKALNDKRRVLILRKTMASQKESCWRLMLQLLSDWKIYGMCHINKSDMTIALPNGSLLLFKGLDDPEKIKSITDINDCWCEELTEFTAEDFDQLILRLRSTKPNTQFFVTFNPVSKANHCYKRWFAPEAVVGDDTFILKTTYKSNRFVPKDYIRNLEMMMITNPTYYKIYALGEFCTLDKLVFNNWKVEEFDHTKLKGELLCGLDFGYVNDLTAFSASILDEENKILYIFKEWCEKGKTNEEISRAISSLGFSKSSIICDSAEPKSIEELKRNGLVRVKPSVKGKDSILNGIQRMQQYRIIIHPSCTNTITEFENYSWKKDKQSDEYINEPIDDFNHSIDSIRYSIQCVGKGHLKSISKQLLGL